MFIALSTLLLGIYSGQKKTSASSVIFCLSHSFFRSGEEIVNEERKSREIPFAQYPYSASKHSEVTPLTEDFEEERERERERGRSREKSEASLVTDVNY